MTDTIRNFIDGELVASDATDFIDLVDPVTGEVDGRSPVSTADDVDRLMYGFSLLVCLPDGMAHPDSAGTGTVLRPATLERYARDAGFAAVDVLPVGDFGFWRFYRLTR